MKHAETSSEVQNVRYDLEQLQETVRRQQQIILDLKRELYVLRQDFTIFCKQVKEERKS